MSTIVPRLRVKAVFLSDVHLGTRGCKSDMLLDFIDRCEAESMYLVGDIVDLWRMKRSWYWPEEHNLILQRLLDKARRGMRISYIPGNHDEMLRGYAGTHFGGIQICKEAIHETVDGRRLLVLHGDAFDGIVVYAKWLALLGDTAYTALLGINHYFNVARRSLGLGYWSLSAYLKFKVKNAVQFVSNYERTVTDEARRRNVDGVVCGHIHHAEHREMDGLMYANTGDWVESCTAFVEHLDGSFELVRWADYQVAAVDANVAASGHGDRKAA